MAGTEEGLSVYVSVGKVVQEHDAEQGVMSLWVIARDTYRAFVLL